MKSNLVEMFGFFTMGYFFELEETELIVLGVKMTKFWWFFLRFSSYEVKFGQNFFVFSRWAIFSNWKKLNRLGLVSKWQIFQWFPFALVSGDECEWILEEQSDADVVNKLPDQLGANCNCTIDHNSTNFSHPSVASLVNYSTIKLMSFNFEKSQANQVKLVEKIEVNW